MSDSGRVQVRIARVSNARDLPLPARATPGSAGFDLHAAVDEELSLGPGERALVPTGFAIAVPPGFEAQIRPRSGLALRHGIVIPNAPGTIDSDYRGELRVILMNAGDEVFTIKRGDRIAQLVVAPVVAVDFAEVEALPESERGTGGFGHSGVAPRRTDG